MPRCTFSITGLLSCGMLAAFLTVPVFAQDVEKVPPREAEANDTKAEEETIYAPLSVGEVRNRLTQWLEAHPKKTDEAKETLAAMWTDEEAKPSATQLLEDTIQFIASVDQPTRELVSRCKIIGAPLAAPEEFYEDLDLSDDFYAAQIQLFYGRYLSQRKMFDEAVIVFEEVDPKAVIDPASLFFHRGCCEHQLYLKQEGLTSVTTLLEDVEDVPTRYSKVATLLKYDFEQMKDKSLGHVAHRMNDSERRLELARSGQRVQKVQGEIVTLLDEIIEKMEQQAGGGGGGNGSGQSNQNKSSSPADESRVKGNTGPGEVDDKPYTRRPEWGDLPEKDIARAANIINKSLPGYYQDAIEEYSKRLAKRKANTSGDADR